jgi:rod shape-determining protein MreC
MAWPPRQRTSSASRRERNLALVRGFVSLAAVAAGLILLVMSRTDPARGQALRTAAADLTAPVWGLVRTPIAAIGGVGDYVGDYFMAIDRNRTLEAELRRYRVRDQQRLALARENRQLKALLRVVEPKRGWYRVLPIAASSSGSYVRSAVVSGGRGSGLAVGQPVRAVRGLVGRVVEVGNNAARVLLLTDASSRVPVRVLRTGRPAMIAGVNAPHLEVRYVAPADGRLKVGDRLVTSGDGGIFPPDVPVAVVTLVKGDLMLARPLAHPEALGYVIVERPYLPPVSVAPAVPAPTTLAAAP